jgi:hypothetical protein
MEAISILASASQLADYSARVFFAAYDYYRKVKDAPARSKELRDELSVISDVM